MSIDWNTGQVWFKLLRFQLLGAGYSAASPYAPKIVEASIPFGAILFWIKRKKFIEYASTLKEETKTNHFPIIVSDPLKYIFFTGVSVEILWSNDWNKLNFSFGGEFQFSFNYPEPDAFIGINIFGLICFLGLIIPSLGERLYKWAASRD